MPAPLARGARRRACVIGRRRGATIPCVIAPHRRPGRRRHSSLARPAAQARTRRVVDQTDRTGDVVIFDGGGTKPTTAQRRSIDLMRFTVTRHGDGVRFTFRIARIVAGRTFDQIVEAQFVKAGRDGFELDVLANPQHKNGTAYVDDTACLIDVRTSRRTGTVRVDVPDRLHPGRATACCACRRTRRRRTAPAPVSPRTRCA